jgi:hypothetical protein
MAFSILTAKDADTDQTLSLHLAVNRSVSKILPPIAPQLHPPFKVPSHTAVFSSQGFPFKSTHEGEQQPRKQRCMQIPILPGASPLCIPLLIDGLQGPAAHGEHLYRLVGSGAPLIGLVGRILQLAGRILAGFLRINLGPLLRGTLVCLSLSSHLQRHSLHHDIPIMDMF